MTRDLVAVSVKAVNAGTAEHSEVADLEHRPEQLDTVASTSHFMFSPALWLTVS